MESRQRSIILSATKPQYRRKSLSGGSDVVDYYFLWWCSSLASVLQWPSPRQSVCSTCLFTCLRQNYPLTATLSAAIGFPLVILLLIPLRTIIIPKLPFTVEELAVLDRPTASPFVSSLFSVWHHIRPCLFSRDNGICRWDAMIPSRSRETISFKLQGHGTCFDRTNLDS